MQTSQYNILIVEDNASISQLIQKNLQTQNFFNIYTTSSVKQAKRLLNKTFFDVICLDIILPDGNGFQLCKDVKGDPHLKSTKIIIISRKVSINYRLEAFQHGADDYLPKPFFPDELNIRIKKLLGLLDTQVQYIKFKNLSLNPTQMRFMYEKYDLPLTNTELLILTYLFNHQGFANLEMLTHFLSSKKLKSVRSQSVVVSMQRLREKLKQATGNPFIKTKYGAGYYLM
jgi:two-component system, OmpR family, response regulator RegX3